jgi:hypothetical protein
MLRGAHKGLRASTYAAPSFCTWLMTAVLWNLHPGADNNVYHISASTPSGPVMRRSQVRLDTVVCKTGNNNSQVRLTRQRNRRCLSSPDLVQARQHCARCHVHRPIHRCLSSTLVEPLNIFRRDSIDTRLSVLCPAKAADPSRQAWRRVHAERTGLHSGVQHCRPADIFCWGMIDPGLTRASRASQRRPAR